MHIQYIIIGATIMLTHESILRTNSVEKVTTLIQVLCRI